MTSVGEHMISHQYGQPVIGAFQDTLIGAALFTYAGQSFSKYHAMRMLADCTLEVLREVNFESGLYTNYDIMSMLLPEINYTGKPKMYDPSMSHLIKYRPEDIKVNIKSGRYLSGIMDKSSVGQDQPGSIAHIIRNQHGSRIALDFLFNLQQMCTNYLRDRGFSLGIRDMLTSREVLDAINEQTSAILLDSTRITEQLDAGDIIAPIGGTVEKHYEKLQANALQIADEYFRIIMTEVNIYNNSLYQLVASGSKGNTSNFLMISSALGQQKLERSRIEMNYGYNRTLPYFTSFDTDPESRGFIPNSYVSGIRPAGLIFGAGDARYSLVKNALTTSVAGAQSRTSIKNLGGTIVNNYRMSAKSQRIVQFIFGESGFDPRTLEVLAIPTVMISDAEFASYQTPDSAAEVKFRNADLRKMLQEEFEQLSADRVQFREIMLSVEVGSGSGAQMVGNRIRLPLNIARIIDDSKTTFTGITVPTGLNLGSAVLRVRELCKMLPYTAFNKMYKERNGKIPERWEAAMTFLRIAIRAYLCTKNLREHGISDLTLDIIVNKINYTVTHAYMAYGTAVGIIAAQSLSQPLTQFVLDSKHRSGGAGSNVDPLTRNAEILGAKPTDKLNSPEMFIEVPVDVETDEQRVQEIANHIEMMIVKSFTSGFELFYEAYGKPVHPRYTQEADLIKTFEKNNPVLRPPTDLINWCVRFELDRRQMIMKNMSLEQIVEAIQRKFSNTYLVYTPETATHIIVRVYFRADLLKRGDPRAVLTEMINKISETVIRGIDGIYAAEVIKDEIRRSYVAPDGSVQVKKIYGVRTSGTNIAAMLSHPMVNQYAIQSNSILEIAEIYGIEAARAKIMNELKSINSATASGGISHCHYSIYADEMTATGYVTNIERPGLSARESNNVLLRMSLASPVQVVEEAAIRGMTDVISGMAASLMVGQTPKIGTAYNESVLNERFVEQHTVDVADVLDDL